MFGIGYVCNAFSFAWIQCILHLNYHYECIIAIFQDTPYEGGYFRISIKLPGKKYSCFIMY